MNDPATTYGAAAAIVMATVAVFTIIMKFWPKSIRPVVEKMDNTLELLIEKYNTLDKKVISLEVVLKEEFSRIDGDISRLDAKNEKLTDLMIRILQNSSKS